MKWKKYSSKECTNINATCINLDMVDIDKLANHGYNQFIMQWLSELEALPKKRQSERELHGGKWLHELLYNALQAPAKTSAGWQRVGNVGNSKAWARLLGIHTRNAAEIGYSVA